MFILIYTSFHVLRIFSKRSSRTGYSSAQKRKKEKSPSTNGAYILWLCIIFQLNKLTSFSSEPLIWYYSQLEKMTFIVLLLVVYVVILFTKVWLAKKTEEYLWDLESIQISYLNRKILQRKRIQVGLIMWEQFQKNSTSSTCRVNLLNIFRGMLEEGN